MDRKNIAIAGLTLISVGLCVELKNLTSDFKTLLEENREQAKVIKDISPVVIDLLFEDRIRFEEDQ